MSYVEPKIRDNISLPMDMWDYQYCNTVQSHRVVPLWDISPKYWWVCETGTILGGFVTIRPKYWWVCLTLLYNITFDIILNELFLNSKLAKCYFWYCMQYSFFWQHSKILIQLRQYLMCGVTYHIQVTMFKLMLLPAKLLCRWWWWNGPWQNAAVHVIGLFSQE
jgi:hypothetical protein